MCEKLDDERQSYIKKILATQFLSSLFTSFRRYCCCKVDYLAVSFHLLYFRLH